jgi:hypothetical protein
VMCLKIAPDRLDFIEFGGVFRQPFGQLHRRPRPTARQLIHVIARTRFFGASLS